MSPLKALGMNQGLSVFCAVIGGWGDSDCYLTAPQEFIVWKAYQV